MFKCPCKPCKVVSSCLKYDKCKCQSKEKHTHICLYGFKYCVKSRTNNWTQCSITYVIFHCFFLNFRNDNYESGVGSTKKKRRRKDLMVSIKKEDESRIIERIMKDWYLVNVLSFWSYMWAFYVIPFCLKVVCKCTW